MDPNRLEIQLFGGFRLHYRGVSCDFSEYLSKHALNLLAVLAIESDNAVTREQLMDLLWPTNDNPVSSLKFNIFRLRKLLLDMPGLQDIELIQTEKGAYQFHPDIAYTVDCALFKSLYQTIKGQSYTTETAGIARRMVELYKGELYHDDEVFWFQEQMEFYRKAYLEVAHELCAYYQKQEQYTDLKAVSLQVATQEPSIEDFHFYYIQSLLKEGAYSAAYEYYQKATIMLVSDYAVSLSKRMLELSGSLRNTLEKKTNIDAIMAYYQNKEVPVGALYCDHTVFDYIYEMCMRNALRSDMQYYMIVFEIQSDGDDGRIEALQYKACASIQTSLRSGDIFMKLNKYQFLVLLPSQSEEQTWKISKRVAHSFQSKIRNRAECLRYHIKKIETGAKSDL